MISSIRNSLKNCRNTETKLYSNLITKAFKLNSIKLNSSINVQFHTLINSSENANLNIKNRINKEKENQKNIFLKLNKFTFSIKNNIKSFDDNSYKGKLFFTLKKNYCLFNY